MKRYQTRCKKCGSTLVAWVQSKRTGKWYLASADVDNTGTWLTPRPWQPHFTVCPGEKTEETP